MNRVLALALFGLSLGVVACDDDALNDVVWVSDPANPALPAYSEWGYNTYGAMINGVSFSSPRYSETWWERNRNAATVTSRGDSLIVSLRDGVMVGGRETVEGIVFRFPFESISDYVGLGALDGRSLDLSSAECSVSLCIGSGSSREGGCVEVPMTVSRGELKFRRVQVVYVDERCREAVLSGCFEFVASCGASHYDVSDGRFDIGVDEDNLNIY